MVLGGFILVPIRCSPFAIRHSPFATHYSLLTTHYSVLAIRYSLFAPIATRYSLFAPPMPLVLVPIPCRDLARTAPVWLPFVERIAERTRNSVAELLTQIRCGEVHLHLAWDPATRAAHALAGTRILRRGGQRVGELVWATGSGRRHWLPLIDDLERYHREHLGCVGMNAVARKGWTRDLEARGYRVTHLVFEKDFYSTSRSPDGAQRNPG